LLLIFEYTNSAPLFLSIKVLLILPCFCRDLTSLTKLVIAVLNSKALETVVTPPVFISALASGNLS